MRRGTSLLLVWCLLLAAGAWWTGAHFRISADLRQFMPEAQTPAQHLLLQNVGESPASRLLLLAVGGDDPADLARVSMDLARSLTGVDGVASVFNGAEDAHTFPPPLLAYRYLVTDSFDAAPLDARQLTTALEERVADMASPAAGLVEEILPRDPTLELLHLAERWQPRVQPRRVDGVWFTADSRFALLVLETRAPAFDPDAQARVLENVSDAFARARGDSSATLRISGTGYFSATIKHRMQGEAALFGAVATLGLLLLMWVAYRRWLYLLSGALPLLTGGLAGLALVGGLFESVHGITLAFGFTLIGVAQDYPVHLFSHLRHDQAPLDTARGIWKPLLTGVLSTCIAYLAFLASGVTGLAQLACLTVTGLAVAAACTRFLLPRMVEAPTGSIESSRWLVALDSTLRRLPRLEWVVLPIVLLCAGALHWAKGPFWQDDLSRLTPLPTEVLRFDASLRRELGTPDLRYLLVVSGATADAVLARLESMQPQLQRLVARHAIEGYEHAAQILPSAALQLRRQRALPEPEVLRTWLREANQQAGFTDDAFEPFVADITRARELPTLGMAQIAATPLGARVGAQFFERDGKWHALVSFAGIGDAEALTSLGGEPDITLLDLKGASQELITAQRAHMLRCLGIAAAALMVMVFLALRSPRRALRVLAPMVITTLLIVAVLRSFDVQLTLFHLISLVLAAGLGLDYALFFEHASLDQDQERTLHALLVCATSTLLVFALLSFSSAPVLQAIGVTVSIGVIGNFLLSIALSRARHLS